MGQNLTRAVVWFDPPAVQLRGDFTRQPAVGRDKGGALPGLNRGAQAQGDGSGLGLWGRRFKQADLGHCAGNIRQVRPLGPPLACDGRGAQGQGHGGVAVWVCGTRRAPKRGIGGINPGLIQQSRETELRMIFTREVAFAVVQQSPPNALRRVCVETRHNHRTLRQLRHCLHQSKRRAARPGGARHDHWMRGRGLLPLGDHSVDDQGLPRLREQAVILRQKVGGDAEKFACALPMIGVLPHVERCDLVGCDAFFDHFAHEIGEAVRQIVKGCARGEIGFGVDQPRDQLR